MVSYIQVLKKLHFIHFTTKEMNLWYIWSFSIGKWKCKEKGIEFMRILKTRVMKTLNIIYDSQNVAFGDYARPAGGPHPPLASLATPLRSLRSPPPHTRLAPLAISPAPLQNDLNWPRYILQGRLQVMQNGLNWPLSSVQDSQ